MTDQLIEYKGAKFTPAQMQVLLESGALGAKNDTVQSTYMQVPHGYSQQWGSPPEGGLLARPGVDPRMFSAVPALPGTLLETLPLRMTNLTNPEYEIITGVDDPSGSNPTGFCGTPPTAGVVKIGTHRASFGKFFMGTEKIILNEVGGRVNLGDTDRMVINNFANMSRIVPDIARNPSINTTLGMGMYRFGIAAHRKMSITLFQGNLSLSNSNTETGFIKEFDGFDRLITTGYTDLESGNAMPAADSIIEDFANADATVGANGIVDLVASIHDRLKDLADKTGLAPLSYGLAMRRDMFRALTLTWPTSYLTTQNQVVNGNGERLIVTGSENVNMRDEMYNNNFLWVYGERVPVFIENGVAQTVGGVGFDSTIYFIPFYAGAEQVTYLEAFDQSNTEIQEFQAIIGADGYRTINGGFYAVTKQQTGFCFEFLFAAQPRLIMRTPFLAARIENVRYKLSNGYTRSALPSEPYYVSGGRYVTNPYSGG